MKLTKDKKKCVLAIALLFSILTNIGAGKIYPQKVKKVVNYNLSVILPLTGNLSFLGIPIKNAFLLAEEDWKNKLRNSGVYININFGDSQGNPKTAVSVYMQNQAIKPANAVFSFLSGQTGALKPIVEQSNALFIAATIDPSICKGSKHLIRPYYSLGAEAKSLLSFIKYLKPKSVGIIYSIDAATAYAAEQITIPGLKSYGIPTTVQTFKVRERNFRNKVQVIKKMSPDIVITNGFGSDLPFLVNTLREQSVFPPATVIGPIGVADAIPGQGTEPFKGMFYFGPDFLRPDFEKNNPEFKDFKNRYIKQFGPKQFGESAVYAYDTYQIIAETLLSVKTTDTMKIFKYITQNNLFGIAGIYNFDESGNCEPSIVLARVNEDGTISSIKIQ